MTDSVNAGTTVCESLCVIFTWLATTMRDTIASRNIFLVPSFPCLNQRNISSLKRRNRDRYRVRVCIPLSEH